MLINFCFPNQTVSLEIELLDNPAVKSWSEHFLHNSMSSKGFAASEWHVWPFDTHAVKNLLEQASTLVNRLGPYGFVYGQPIPQQAEQVDRDFTNSLHRFFTHSQRIVHNMTVEQRDQQYLLTEWLMKVNDCVHAIERYLPTAAPKWPLHEISVYQAHTYDAPGWWFMQHDWRQYHTGQHHDVILGPEILGKTVLKSYIDGDNPNDWDTTGHYSNHGSLVIQAGPTVRHDVYRSLEFNQWLERWGITYDTAWFDFPIGNVKDQSQLASMYQFMVGSEFDTGPEFTVTLTKN